MPFSPSTNNLIGGKVPIAELQGGQVFAAAVDPIDAETGALRIASDALDVGGGGGLKMEKSGTYTSVQLEVEDLDPGATVDMFTVGARAVEIRRILAEFETVDGSNVFKLILKRVFPGPETREFTVAALSDATKQDYVGERRLLLLPGDIIACEYAGLDANDLWVDVVTEEV